MNRYSLTHVADQTLLRDLATFNTQERTASVEGLARLAEVEVRRLYLQAAHSSMYSYCLGELHMSEDIALKRLRAARAARRFPAIYAGLEDGRLHLSGVALLARHLTKDNWQSLLRASVHKTKAEIELLLAQRFPQQDVPTLVRPLDPAVVAAAPGVGPMAPAAVQPVMGPAEVLPAPGPVNSLAPQPTTAQLASPPTYTRLAPLAPERFALQTTVDQETHDLLRYAQALLGHAVPSGDLAAVIKHSALALVRELEQQKFAKCARSRPRRGAPKGRYIPAEVRRKVFQRDEGRCTFVSDGGKRCDAISRLEFDHVEAFAKGGQSTAKNMRLRCRAHNQYTAEHAFGAGFMQKKREESRQRTAEAKAQAEAKARAKADAGPYCVRGAAPMASSSA